MLLLAEWELSCYVMILFSLFLTDCVGMVYSKSSRESDYSSQPAFMAAFDPQIFLRPFVHSNITKTYYTHCTYNVVAYLYNEYLHKL
jgi:hypothetical protein